MTTGKKMTTADFSKFVMGVDDLYNAALRNGYYLPKQSCSAINEITLVNILKKEYWCPRTEDVRIKNCVKAPVKESLFGKLENLLQQEAQHQLDRRGEEAAARQEVDDRCDCDLEPRR
jgi:hypothetical protein